MRIGLFFGSFNPIHIGHLALANYMVNYTEMQEVWLVVSPHNPLKKKSQLLNQNDRLHLVNLALDFHPSIKASNFEFDLPQPSYTINTLVRLKEKYPQHEFSLIMGQDNLTSFNKWKNYEEILKRNHIYVYHFTEAPVMDISSTFIRNAIKEKKDVRFFTHPKVWEEIDTMNFYKK